MYQPIEIKKFEEKEKASTAEFYLNSIKDIGNNLFDFVDQSIVGDTVDYAASGFKKDKIPPTVGILANNIGEFGVNLLPVMDKLVDFMGKPPGPDGKIPDVFNNDEKLMEWSGDKVQYFRENRAKFKEIQDDKNMASQFANLVVQDMAVSLPLYEGLTKAGVPKMWATVLGFGMGSAIALEDKIFGAESTFIQEFGKEEVNALKKILSIIPNTPVDALADEVIQTLEYTAFAFAIPPVIQAAKFMKNNLPSFAVGGAVAAGIEGQDPNIEPTQEFNLGTEQGKKKSNLDLNDDQSAIPGTVNEYGFEKTSSLKALVNAVIPKKVPVFNSAVKEAVSKIAEKGTGDQILGTIKNIPNVKSNEIKWIGLDDFLKGKKSVTKKEVVDFVNQNNIDITEVKQGGNDEVAKFSDELESDRNVFEQKWLKEEERRAGKKLSEQEQDMLLQNNLNYDGIEVFVPKDATYSRITFGEFDSYFGKELFEGNIKANKIFKGPEGQDFKITQLELEKFLIEKRSRAERSMLKATAPKFEQYTEPGGTDYTELVFKIKKGGMDVGIPTSVSYEKVAPPGISLPEVVTEKSNSPFKSSAHMNIKSEIAHVRFKTRDLNGMKVLTVEEMQSDFAILAAKSGRATGLNESSRAKKVDFPFKNNWYEMVLKRLIRHAADNGFDAVGIPKGIVSAERYGQELINSKQIQVNKFDDEVSVYYLDDAGKSVDAIQFSADKEGITKLQKTFGPKIYDKIMSMEVDNPQKFNIDKAVSIGSGKGKGDLYDKAIPSFLKKYSKKWNAKVYDDTIDAPRGDNTLKEMPVTILEITPSMKKSVQEEGQSLFEILGIGGAGAVGAKAVSDSQGNNTISNLTQ